MGIVPLGYQITEYDCGPTTMLNVFSYLFDRKQLQPDMVAAVYRYCLDGFSPSGVCGKTGTSREAMEFMSHWFNHYCAQRNFPGRSEILTRDEVFLGEGSKIIECLNAGGCAVVRCFLCCCHYVLLTAVEGDKICLFDPYFNDKLFRRRDIELITDQPCKMNRRVPFERMNSDGKDYYALGPYDMRECVLYFNTETKEI